MRNGYAVAPGIGNKKESFLIIAEEIINLVSVKCTSTLHPLKVYYIRAILNNKLKKIF
jgi:hypothetical protein